MTKLLPVVLAAAPVEAVSGNDTAVAGYCIENNRDRQCRFCRPGPWLRRCGAVYDDLPELAVMMGLSAGTHIWIVAGVTGMRAGLRGLAAKARSSRR